MKVIRANLKDNTLENRHTPFIVNYGKEELLAVFDQSSSCIGLTIGNRKGEIRELITFERESRQGETTPVFLNKLKTYLIPLFSKMNIVCFSLEAVILSGYYESDKVVKEVRGALLQIWQSGKCLNSKEEIVPLPTNSRLEEINNKEWKGMIVPLEAQRRFDDIKKSIHYFVGELIPLVKRMKQDIADSFCMFLFLIKTRYGNEKLKANKSSVNKSHNLVMVAFAYDELTLGHKPLADLNPVLTSKLNGDQLDYLMEYRKSLTKKYLALLNSDNYDDEYTLSNLSNIQSALVNYMKAKEKKHYDEMMDSVKFFPWNNSTTEYREFEFNDKLTVEDNMRCFTGRDRNIYFSVIPNNLAYCYAIPMFKMRIGFDSKILIVGTRY